MKKHAIIPLFIPHLGCPHDCVFCNQKIITAKTQPITPDKIQTEVESKLISLKTLNVETLEIAFFGGSFTALPLDYQKSLLETIHPYKANGDVSKIRLSTRPDSIDHMRLDLLEEYGVDIIELGAQSFDNEVLRQSERGHTKEQTEQACKMIHDRNFSLGLQLMVGLPSDTVEKSVKSAKSAIDMRPDFVRIYPTVVLKDTELAARLIDGSFNPFTRDEMIHAAKQMVWLFNQANVPVIRLGLKSTDFVTPLTDLSHTYHPAFRQVVESELALDQIRLQLARLGIDCGSAVLSANSKSFSNLIGHHASNRVALDSECPNIVFRYQVDDELGDYEYRLYIT